MTDSGSLLIHPIARIQTGFSSKFGIPRQSGLVETLQGRVVFEPEYRQAEALRELEGFSHIWLIWHFSACSGRKWHATVRPPRLGGNRRVGVFASRSPFRPNGLGLSCVRLTGIDCSAADGPVLLVAGADLLDGTPVFDIKPYVPLTDCRPDAAEGYTAGTKTHLLQVDFPPALLEQIPEMLRAPLLGILAEDPRPGYDDSPEKVYGLPFAGFDIGFAVEGETLRVFRVTAYEDGRVPADQSG